MATLHLLGTGAAYSGPDRTTTMLALETAGSVVVIDCGADAIQRLLAAGCDPDKIALLILTHEHPDHITGFPLLIERLWLAKRRRPLPVCGPGAALDKAKRIFEVFDTSGWEGLPEIQWHIIPLDEGARVWFDEHWRITSSPGDHGVPVLATRIEDLVDGGVVAYSADTARSESVARLAARADILVHEATGEFNGHTTVQDAAHIARQAGVGKLVLVHLPPKISSDALEEARSSFPATELGRDGARYTF